MEILLGAGSSRERRIAVGGRRSWRQLVTLDHNEEHRPDVVWDLERRPLPFGDDTADEIHAYEVLEHIGRQGDWRAFFEEFSEYYRILRPGGFLAATCPSYRSSWAWGDPSHRRVITSGTLVFLDQQEYVKQVGKTAMSDFRFCWSGDFRPVYAQDNGEGLVFVLEAVKPSRWSRP